MSGLYVIGNGFDLAHGLETQYKQFKYWINKYVGGIPPVAVELPDLITDGDSDKDLSKKFRDSARYFAWLLDKAAGEEGDNPAEWSDFERYLGKLNYESAFCRCASQNLNRADVYERLIQIQDTLGRLFFDWIASVDVENCYSFPSFERIINKPDNLILSFNYTETIEKLYKVREENICHIHGARETDPVKIEANQNKWNRGSCVGKNGENLIMGFYAKNSDLMSRYTGQDAQIGEYYNLLDSRLRKSPGRILSDPDIVMFMNKIEHSHFENIYSFGFSFSSTDVDQLEEIVKRVQKGTANPRKLIWHHSCYDAENVEKMNKYNLTLSNAGFKGSIGQPWDLGDKLKK